MKSKKIVTAGALVREIVYPWAAAREPAKIRRAKRKLSTEAQQRMNAKYSWEKLEMQLAANYGPGDLVACLTFDDEHLPPDRKGVLARLKRFRSDIAEVRKRKGQPLPRIHWAVENVHDSGRWHVHIVIDSTGDDFRDIISCWPYGTDIEITRLRLDSEKNYETLARYMCKEARERPGLRSWSYTRNCRKPEVETFPVPDGTDIQPPEDATVIADEIKRTEYAEYHFIKYLTVSPQQLQAATPKTRRRK